MATALEPAVQAEVVSIPLSLIDRDPNQPRFAENVDTDLAPSFKEHGWFPDEPLKVRPHPENPERFMLVNGERRYAGAKAAGLKDALCVFSLDEEGEREADRLIVQIVSNTGKPLTPIEEALAFRRIIADRRMDRFDPPENGKPPKLIEAGDKKYGAVALARELGISKSTVTDRLAVTEIPEFWIKFIVAGPLQTSHVPALHKIREMPEKYQLRVLARMQEHHEWPTPDGKASNGHRHRKEVAGERIQVEEFERMLDDALRPFIRPLGDVGAAYKGPSAKLKDGVGYYSKVRPMAIDPSQWEPILRKKRLEKAAKTRAAGGAQAKQADQYREQQARRDAERRREDEKRRRWWKARPQILTALAEKIGTMSLGQLQTAIVDTLGVQKDSKNVGKLVAKGTTAEQFVRHLAMCAISDDADYEYGFAEKAAKIGKRFGVNVATIVKEEEADKEAVAPAAGSGDVGAGPDGDDESDES